MGKRKNLRKLISSVLLLSFSFQQSMLAQSIANPSNITGITPVGGANGEFDILPSMIKDGVGFRHYANFKLSEQDIANLIFKYGQENVAQFVNLVDNRIEINGIVNTMRDNNFYNGHAIFVSPNGMVVGASGVLNVGSLTAIAPNVNSYLKYTGYYMGSDYMRDAADSLGVNPDLINIPGINDEVNLKLLKESNMGGNITINGRVFARDSVELIGKNVTIGNTVDSKAGIFAGLPTEHDEKIMTLAQADNLFNHLVNNNIQHGSGFDRDSKGNVVIKAQSFQDTTISVSDTLIVEGINYAIEELFEVVAGKILVKVNLPNGLTAAQVLASLAQAKSAASPADASDPNSINGAHAAKVDISNVVVAGKNVDVNAVSKNSYVAQKGSSLFERAVNDLFIDENTDSDAERFINSFAGGTATFEDFEGARAGATVVIGDNSTLYATKDVDVKALSVADLAVQMYAIKQPMADTTSEAFYYLGSQTNSSVIVKSAAEIIAGEDVNLLAASKNNIFVRIKNPTAGREMAGQKIVNFPSIQTSLLQTVAKADTTLEVQNGATIKAGRDVNAVATNVTSDQTILKSVASIIPSTSGTETSGIAVAVNLKESELNTLVKMDGKVDAGRDVNLNAQTLHLSDTQSMATVAEPSGLTFTGTVAAGIAEKITGLVSSKISGIHEVLDSVCNVTSKIPSSSVALNVNNSKVDTRVSVGRNAVIDAINDINVVANTIDLVTNYANAEVEIKDATLTNAAYNYSPAPGVAIILNSQNNNTEAVIENGELNSGAKLNAGNTITVNATTEQPMNDSTLTLALNIVQAGVDADELFNGSPDNDNTAYATLGSDDWDFRVLLGNFTAPKDELVFDIKNVIYGFKSTGITSNLGLQGFFNNWAQATSQNQKGVGLAASVLVSDVVNNTIAKVGDYATLNSDSAVINAANKVVQFNAAGDVGKLWHLTSGANGGSGIGGTVVIENVDNYSSAEIRDNATITLANDLNVLSASDQDYLTLVMTGSKASTAPSGLALSGSTIVQQVGGETKSSIGSSKIKAKNLNLKASEANINKVPDALDQLQNNPFADLDDNKFQTTLEPDMYSSEVKRFTDTDVSLAIDSELGYNPSGLTDVSVITGTGLATLEDAVTIKDGISNLIITGALSKQESDSNINGAGTSSSGIAVGASVNVSLISREVNAAIADGAVIELDNDLNVIADTKTQTLNLAVAGAFAGGVDMHKVANFVDSTGTKLRYKSQKYLPIAQWSHGKINGILNKFKDSPRNSGKIDEKGNPYIEYKGVEYKPDLNGQYYDPSTGTVLKDSAGNPITVQNSGLNKNNSTVPNLANQTTDVNGQNQAMSNMSAALAGGATVIVTQSDVKAEVGKASITIGKDVNVKANQVTNNLNISTGVAKAATVGAGASANIIDNSNSTSAIVDGATLNFKNNLNNLNINANEDTYGVQVAIGVGASSATVNNPTAGVAVGGSFNADVLLNSVTSELKNATISNLDGQDSINVNVTADNYSESYKGAGGMSINIASSSSAVGAAMAGNINAHEKVTVARIENSTVKDAKTLAVLANGDSTKPTEKIIDVQIGGSLVTGGSSSFTFDGALSTNVFLNSVYAEIANNTRIDASNVGVDVLAYNNLTNWSSAGSIGISATQSSLGVGVGAILNVLNNEVHAKVSNSIIDNAKSLDVEASNQEDLSSVALNFGFGSGLVISPNGIVNVSKNAISAEILNSTVSAVGDVNVRSKYESDIFAVPALAGVAAGNGFVFDANILSNSAITDNVAKVVGSTIATANNLVVNAETEEKIELYPVTAAAAQTSSSAANVSINVVSNLTHANVEDSDISTKDVSVKASDNTQSKVRGGTLAASGTASVAGSMAVDVFVKDVDAHISKSTLTNSGDISVNATAKNIFGAENPGGITASDIANDVANGSYDVANDLRFDKWDMTYDISGSGTAAVSGSLISKAVANDVKAYIGANTDIKSAEDISVKAENITHSAAIIGNVAGSGTAAVGSSLYLNVNTADVDAYIAEGSKLGSVSKVGNVDVSATSDQIYNALNFAVGGSGVAAVSGSLISNIVVNDTNAYIAKNVVINSSDSISVKASDDLDIQATQLLVSGSGTVAVSAVSNVNVLNNRVSAVVGKNSDSDTSVKGSITSENDVVIEASASQGYQANIISVSGSGVVAPNAVALSNTMASEVASGIEEISIKSNSGSVSVKSTNAYNEKHKNQTSGIREMLDSFVPKKNPDGTIANVEEFTPDDLSGDDYVPLVGAVNLSGSGVASIAGVVVNNNVITEVDAYVRNADVVSSEGLSVNANSMMTTYDAVGGLAIAGTGANVAASGVVNVYAGNTVAEVINSNIDGSLSVSAEDAINLNTITFMVSAGLVGAAVTPVANVNTVSNSVIARVVESEIVNASTLKINAKNLIQTTNAVATGTAEFVGGSVGLVPLTNVFVGTTKAYSENSKVSGNNVVTEVSAIDHIDTSSFVGGVAINAIGANVNGYALTNVFDNNLNSYLENVEVKDSSSISVIANSDFDAANFIVGGGLSVFGASVLLNSIANVVDNSVNSYISDSSLTNGSVDVLATQSVGFSNISGTGSLNAIGNSTIVSSIANVLLNDVNSHITNTLGSNLSTINVTTDSYEFLSNINWGVVISGTAATTANSVVNVLENTSSAKVDAKDKFIKSTGKLKVESKDVLEMTNHMGLVAGSILGSAGANVNVNVLNNTVNAEVLSNTDGQIDVGSLQILSESKMILDEQLINAAGGLAVGVAGGVIVNSIGSKVNTNDSDLQKVFLDESLAEANKIYNQNSSNIIYEKDGSSKTLANRYSLTGSSNMSGTISNLSANVKTSQTTNNNEIDIQAHNVVKGVDSDTLKLNNYTGSAGLGAASAAVIVHDVEYNTAAKISGGQVISSNGDVLVKSSSGSNVSLDAVEASLGVIGLSGNVGYIKNNAITQSIVSSAGIESKSLTIDASSSDNIKSNVSSYSISGVAGEAAVSKVSTSNKVLANITGNNVDITTDSLNIKSSNTSKLSSELQSYYVSGIELDVLVNQAKSDAVINALVDATGSIDVKNAMNILATSDGITVDSTVNLGSASLAAGNVIAQSAIIDSDFKAGISNSNLSITNSGKTVIKSGVKTSNNNEVSEMKASINAGNSTITLIDVASGVDMTAEVSATTEVVSNAKKHSAKSIDMVSKLKRTVSAGSSSETLGAVSLNFINLNAKANGSNKVTLNGNHEVEEKISLELSDDASTFADMVNASLTLGSGTTNTSLSEVNTNTNVNVLGQVNAESLSIKNTVNRNVKNSAETDDTGFVAVSEYSLQTKARGDSSVDFGAKMTNSDYKNSVGIDSNIKNYVESIYSEDPVALVAIGKNNTSENSITAMNAVNISDAEVVSSGNFNVASKSANSAVMKKDSGGIGFVVFTDGELSNTVNGGVNLNIINSKINAKDINISTNSTLGSSSDPETKYTVSYSDAGIHHEYATISNSVTQKGIVDFVNSNLVANDSLNLKMKTDSVFKQAIKSDGQGFVAKNMANSDLTVNNSNTLNLDSNSKISAKDVSISMDSDNDLSSTVNIDVSHFGGRDPIGTANLNLNVDNKINNSGAIIAGKNVNIDLMDNSYNKLNQNARVIIEAAVATGGARGALNYTTNNSVNVLQNASIVAGKDVSVKYMQGETSASSSLYTKKISRILLGIPITDVDSSSNYRRNVNHSMTLNGEIVAGSGARKYMKIDKDGNIVTDELKGFISDEYKIINSGTIDGALRTQNAIDELNTKIQEIDSNIAELEADELRYQNELNSSEEKLEVLEKIRDFTDTTAYIVEADALDLVKGNLNTLVVDDSDANKLSQATFDKLASEYRTYVNEKYNNQDQPLNIQTIEAYLNDFVVTDAVLGANGNVIQPEVKLTDAQITTILSAIDVEKQKVQQVAGLDIVLYDNKLVVQSADRYQARLDKLNATIDNISETNLRLEETIDGYATQISELNSEKTAYNDLILHLQQNPLESVDVAKSAIEFSNLSYVPGKITLTGIKNNEISGTGDFKSYSPNLVVDNYSNRDLIFNYINFGSTATTGLNIYGKNYNQYANTLKQVNSEISEFNNVPDTEIGTTVHYVIDGGIPESDRNNLLINNYFDHSNPILSEANAVPSNVTFNGMVNVSNKFEVFNDSGNIIFKNAISSATKNFIATQGDVLIDASRTSLALAVGDEIFAGRNVDIKVSTLTNNGKILAGYSDRNLKITDSMLSNLIVDPTTGERNMIDWGGNEKSAYLASNNNIKALYKDGKILLFNTKQEGGQVKISATNSSGSGTTSSTNGFANISIVNNTNKEIVINNLENNRMGNSNSSQAKTTIDSVGKVTVAGNIIQGKNSLTQDGLNKLSISSEKGIEISDRLLGAVVPAIDAVGDVNLSNSNSNSIAVNAIINVTDGNLNISNSGENVLINSSIKNSNGNIVVNNEKGSLIVTEIASITNNNANVTINNYGTNTEISGAIKNEMGSVDITNKNGKLLIANQIDVTSGNTTITNEGNSDLELARNAKLINEGLDTEIKVVSTNGGITIAEDAEVTNISETAKDNLTITNSGNEKISILGKIFNKKGNTTVSSVGSDSGIELGTTGSVITETGNAVISNTGKNGIVSSGVIESKSGDLTITNEGEEGIKLSANSKTKTTGADSKLSINNSNGGVTIAEDAEVTNISETAKDNLTITNSGNEKISILGKIFNKKGNTTVSSVGSDSGIELGTTGSVITETGNAVISNTGKNGIVSSGVIESKSGDLTITNEGEEGIKLSANSKTKTTGADSKLSINNSNGGVTIAEDAEVTNISETAKDNLTITNNGNEKISILGKIFNKKGDTTVSSTGSDSGIELGTTGLISSGAGAISLTNTGSQGVDIEGKVSTEKGDILVVNKDSDLVIGEYDSDNDNYISAIGNVIITQTNGSIINGVTDTGSVGNNQNHDLGNIDKAYKTLVRSTENLEINVESGNIGQDTNALNGKESGFGTDASTRDYTESINVNVGGFVTANATNNNNALINLRAKDSDMRINMINSDGNIILTVADWKQADQRPVPTDEAYYHGYSVLNNAINANASNLVGRNISIISSDNIGTSSNAITYTQLTDGSISVLAENDINISDNGEFNKIEEMISKRGDITLNLDGDSEITEITSGKKLIIKSTAKNLTIYDLGKISGKNGNGIDLLYPHDDIALTGSNGLVPEQIEIYVLDTNQSDPNLAGSTLNIYSAYLKGADNGSPDVKLRADNIIAHAYEAPSSYIYTTQNPTGFDAKDGRIYEVDGTQKLAAGFNTVGVGKSMTFDIQGVSPEDVINAGKNQNSRNYHSQNPVDTISEFTNNNAFEDTVYKVHNVSLSLNSSSESPIDNRGMQLNNLYADNAYVDTKDLTMNLIDGYITNYAEFTNGNRGATGGAHTINGDYRWLNIVDNDFKRNLSNIYNLPLTAQLYTEQTGSFSLSMGDKITQKTTAPIIAYNVDNAVNTFSTENSFYRLTYKDNKIQDQSLANFVDRLEKESIDSDRRDFIRFVSNHEKGIVKVSNIIPDSDSKVLAVHDISRGGLLVTHDGSLKLNEKFLINLKYYEIDVDVEVKVVRLHSDKAGLEFVNMDEATANKILYLNMSVDADSDINVKKSEK